MDNHIQTTSEPESWNIGSSNPSQAEHAPRDCNPATSQSLQASPHLEAQKTSVSAGGGDQHEAEMITTNQRMQVETNNAYSPQYHGCNVATEASTGQLFAHTREEVGPFLSLFFSV